MYDGNGNVGQMVDGDDGELEASYEYDPYGNLINSAGTYAAVNPFRFSTKYFDVETELYYYGYRYYLLDLGRWVNRDPIGENGGINLYEFVENGPINGTDPFGQWKWKGGKRQGGRRATVVAESCQDPYENLAKLTRLSLEEIGKWLKEWKNNSEVQKDDEFTVPNSFIVGLGQPDFLGTGIYNPIMDYANNSNEAYIRGALKSRGFWVKTYEMLKGTGKKTVTTAIKNNDTWGYAFMGHGRDDGSFSWDTSKVGIYPYHIRRWGFRYGLGINYHCYARNANWGTLSMTHFGASGVFGKGVALIMPLHHILGDIIDIATMDLN